MYKELQSLHQVVAGPVSRNPGTISQVAANRTVALHLDFVAKPSGCRELSGDVAAAIEEAQLANEGLETSLLLVCEREARLVTLLTFWDRGRFLTDRESRISWMQKLLAPFADGAVRAHTSLPRLVAQEARELPAAKPPELGSTQFREVTAG